MPCATEASGGASELSCRGPKVAVGLAVGAGVGVAVGGETVGEGDGARVDVDAGPVGAAVAVGRRAGDGLGADDGCGFVPAVGVIVELGRGEGP